MRRILDWIIPPSALRWDPLTIGWPPENDTELYDLNGWYLAHLSRWIDRNER